MKKNLLYFLSLLVFVTFTTNVYADDKKDDGMRGDPDTYAIDMVGRLGVSWPRYDIPNPDQPLEVSHKSTDRQLEINFLSSIEDVDIFVTDATGAAVIQNSVYVNINSTVNLNLTGLPQGTYSIRLLDQNGDSVHGNFTIE
jgi:hypothetical protein